jgi:hypothetical protein
LVVLLQLGAVLVEQELILQIAADLEVVEDIQQ